MPSVFEQSKKVHVEEDDLGRNEKLEGMFLTPLN